MKSFWAGTVVTACLTAGLLAAGAAPAVAAGGPHEERESLGAVITDAIRANGPFFTPLERALIEAKCGYRPGEWDGLDLNISRGVFHCSNGRKVDDPEMRAMLAAAQPRISAKISKAMTSPKVREAIRTHADEAARRALENLAGPSRDRD